MDDLISRQAAIEALADMHCKSDEDEYVWIIRSDAWARIDALPSAQPEKRTNKRTETHSCDSIDRQAAIDALGEKPLAWTEGEYELGLQNQWQSDVDALNDLPSAQPEPLTDKEQRIFLAAMGREEKICEEADRDHVREPYEDSLVRVCHKIVRKVKGALWT